MTWPLVETSSGVSASIPTLSRRLLSRTRARLFPVRGSFLRIQEPPYGHDHASVRTSTSATTARWSGETIKIGIAGSIRAALATGWPMTSASPSDTWLPSCKRGCVAVDDYDTLIGD